MAQRLHPVLLEEIQRLSALERSRDNLISLLRQELGDEYIEGHPRYEAVARPFAEAVERQRLMIKLQEMAVQPRVGRRVTLLAGRGVKKGMTGVITWTNGMQVAVRDAQGKVYTTSADNVEVVTERKP